MSIARRKIVLLFHILILFAITKINGQTTELTVASVEFTPVAFATRNFISTKEQATDIMTQNIQALTTQYISQSSAEVMVFPEYGIYGGNFTSRNSIYPFLEVVPDPSSSSSPINPCENEGEYKESPILIEISCLAKKYGKTFVFDIGSYENCTKKTSSNCPHDNRFQFNTQVAFDPQGNLVGRYRKYHLYHEPWFDTPSTPDISTFEINGNKFGLAICFDLLFKEPSYTLVYSQNISTLLYSSWWANFPPALISIEVQQAWSRAYTTNLVASNFGLDGFKSSGSGIYSKGNALVTYFNDKESCDSMYLEATIQVDNLDEDVRNIDVDNYQLNDYSLLKSLKDFEKNVNENNVKEKKLFQEKEYKIDFGIFNEDFQDKFINQSIIQFQFAEIKAGEFGAYSMELDQSGFFCNFTYEASTSSSSGVYSFVIIDAREIPFVLPAPALICGVLICDNSTFACSFSSNDTFNLVPSNFSYLSISGLFDPSYVVYTMAMTSHTSVISSSQMTSSSPFNEKYHDLLITNPTDIYNALLMQVPAQ